MIYDFRNQKVLFLLAVLYVFPIILSNVYYTDDMNRAIYGYGWPQDGRFLASLIMQGLSFGSAVMSLFPYSTIVASIVMLLSGYILSNILFAKHRDVIPFTSLLLLTSPFFLENISYRFDAIPMSLSVLFSIIPFLWRSNRYFIAIASVFLYLSFSLYQTSAMIFLSVSVCLALLDADKDKIYILKCILLRSIPFFLSYAVYTFTLKVIDIELGRASFIPLDSSTFPIIIERVHRYLGLFDSLLKSKYIVAISPMFALFVAAIAIILIKSRFNIVNIICMLLCVLLTIILITLPNILLSDIWYTSRTMVAYPIVIFSILLFTIKSESDILKRLLKLSCALIIFYSFLLCSVFSSALKINNDFSNFVSSLISKDIMEVSGSNHISIAISGRIPYDRKANILYSEFPILYNLAPTYMVENWTWGIADASKYIEMSWASNYKDIVKNRCSAEMLKENRIYSIKKYDESYIIDFNKSKCN